MQAKGQVANFHIEEHFTEGKILSYLNHYLPDDIAVIAIEQVDERFHSRYAAKKKTYRYHIHMGEISDVFERKYEYQYEKILDVESMKEAASYLIGTHDFTSFCGNKKMKKTAVRSIYEINFTKKGNDLWIDYRGNGFLQNMVRILTGTLIEVGVPRGRYATGISSILWTNSSGSNSSYNTFFIAGLLLNCTIVTLVY